MNDMSTKEKLVKDMKNLGSDIDTLLHESAASAGERADELTERLKSRLLDVKERLTLVEENLLEKTKQAASVADDFAHDHPWKTVGIAGALGLIIGLLIGRR